MASTDRVSKAKARLLMNHPFFATLLLQTPIVLDEHVEYAATDMKRIMLNPRYAETASVPSLMTDLAHEAGGHIAFLHSVRQGVRDHQLWNIACDHAVNLMLKEQGFAVPEGGWLCDEKYAGWSAEKIYDDLLQQGRGGGQPERDRMHGDLLPTHGRDDPAEYAETVRLAKQKVAQAAMAAKLAGKLRGELAKLVDEFLEPRVPWPDVLRDYLLRIVKDDESWVRRNRRFSDVYLPARHSEAMGPIVIIGDSSGSIWCSPEELEQFATEIQSVADLVQPEHIRLIWADTEVRGEEVFEQGDPLKFEVKGGGGTDMRAPLAHVEQYAPEVVILLTDGYTPWPAEPDYPLIVCCSTDTDVPIGNVIRLNA